MSPEASITLVDSSNRVKQTYACEACRRRKARCSGTAPCSLCQKTGQECEFVYQRHRRGRKTGLQQNAPRLVLPAPSLPRRQPLASSTKLPTSTQPRTHAPPIAPTTTISETLLGFQQPSPPNASQVEDHRGISPIGTVRSDEDTEIPRRDDLRPTQSATVNWPVQLSCLLEQDLKAIEYLPSNRNPPSIVPYVLHLLDLFFSTVSRQYPCFITKEYFLRTIQQGACRPHLCYAIGAISLPWSRRKQFQENDFGPSLHQRFTSNVRTALACASQLQNPVGLLSFCAVIISNTSQGNGAQAWLDIGTANSLLRLISIQDQDEEMVKAVATVEEFLDIMELSLTFGHPRFYAYDRMSCDTSNQPKMQSSLHNLCHIFVRIQKQSTLGFTDMFPPPWSSRSIFMSLRQELEFIQLSLPDVFSCDDKHLRNQFLIDDSIAQHALASVVWHLSVLLLNNIFLPIPVISSLVGIEGGANTSLEGKVIDFPFAPRLFLRERAIACEASAAGIARICKSIMSSGVPFLTPFLGYACFHSALVFINQLKREPSTARSNVELQLRYVLTILGAIRNFHKPASAWINALKDVQCLSLRAGNYEGNADIFKGFFSRFEGIIEPPFVSLDPTSVTRPASPDQPISQPKDDAAQDPNVGITDNSNSDWMNAYQSQLEGDLDPVASEEQHGRPIDPFTDADLEYNSTRSQETFHMLPEYNEVVDGMAKEHDTSAMTYVSCGVPTQASVDMSLFCSLDQDLPDSWVNGLLDLFSSDGTDLGTEFSGFDFQF